VITSVSRASLRDDPLPIEANRPSVDSRITTRSMPRWSAPTIGLAPPESAAPAAPGIEVEMKAQFHLRHDLGVIG